MFSLLSPSVAAPELMYTVFEERSTRCNSELVLWAISAAVVRARRASLEPSVASRIFVGNMLIEVTS